MKLNYLFSSAKTFLHYIFLLKKYNKKNSTQKEQMLFKELKNQIEFAWEHIPFYRNHWQKHNFSPDKFQSFEDMKLIPIINKNTVREHLEEMVNPNYPKSRLTLVTTGGTTGMPMKFYIDNYFARGKEMAFQIQGSWTYWKYRFFINKVAIIRGFSVDKKYIDNKIYWQKSNRDNGLVFSSFHLNKDTYKTYLDKLRSFKPKYIKAYPSSIVALCILMKQNNDYGIKGLKAVICSSENIYDSHRDLIKEVLGVEIYSFYGHSEKSVSAFQNKDIMEFQPLYGYTEFLDANNEAVSQKGEMANIICTSLNNKYFPFIRYNTNDIIEVADAQNKTAKRILGRAQEFIVDKDGTKVLFTCADEIFWEEEGITAYQYVQNEVGKISINIETDSKFASDTLDRIRFSAKEMFSNFDIEIINVPKIEKTKAGKFRYLIQNLKIE